MDRPRLQLSGCSTPANLLTSIRVSAANLLLAFCWWVSLCPGPADYQHGRQPGGGGHPGLAPERLLQPLHVRIQGLVLHADAGERREQRRTRGQHHDRPLRGGPTAAAGHILPLCVCPRGTSGCSGQTCDCACQRTTYHKWFSVFMRAGNWCLWTLV